MPQTTSRQDRILRWLRDHKSSSDTSLSTISRALVLNEGAVKADIQALQEMGFVSGPPSLLVRCQELLESLDGEVDRTSEQYPAFIILIASLIAPADEMRLADELGYDKEMVAHVGARLRNAKIWSADDLSPAVRERWGGESGGIAFWLDAHVAAGLMECRDGDAASSSYKMTPEGRRHAERVLGLKRS